MFLVASSISSNLPPITRNLIDNIYQMELRLHENLNIVTTIVGVYDSNRSEDRYKMEPILMSYLPGNTLILGDINGTSSLYDSQECRENKWKFFTSHELYFPYFKKFWEQAYPKELWPMTRVRRKTGQSYIDKRYCTVYPA